MIAVRPYFQSVLLPTWELVAGTMSDAAAKGWELVTITFVPTYLGALAGGWSRQAIEGTFLCVFTHEPAEDVQPVEAPNVADLAPERPRPVPGWPQSR